MSEAENQEKRLSFSVPVFGKQWVIFVPTNSTDEHWEPVIMDGMTMFIIMKLIDMQLEIMEDSAYRIESDNMVYKALKALQSQVKHARK